MSIKKPSNRTSLLKRLATARNCIALGLLAALGYLMFHPADYNQLGVVVSILGSLLNALD